MFNLLEQKVGLGEIIVFEFGFGAWGSESYAIGAGAGAREDERIDASANEHSINCLLMRGVLIIGKYGFYNFLTDLPRKITKSAEPFAAFVV